MMVDVEALSGRPYVRGVALFVERDAVSSRGELAPFALEDVALAARHVFRETQPTIEHLDFVLADRRLFVAPSDDGLLFVLVDVATTSNVVFDAAAEGAAAPVAAEGSAPPVEADPALSVAELLAAANAILVGLKRSVGGPVLRNYFNKVQKARLEASPALAAVAAELNGELRLKDASVDGAVLGPALGAAMADLISRLAVVAPEVANLDLRAECAPVAPARALERVGFFGVNGGGRWRT